VSTDKLGFEDCIQGYFEQNLAQAVGDFVLKRADGLFAYQLAVVIDDAEQGVTDVVRGSDLLGATPQQIYLQKCLNLPTPTYAHLPVVIDESGHKLSKRHGAVEMTQGIREQTLWRAFDFLNLSPPDDLLKADLNSLWQWAFSAWALAKVPHCLEKQ
jgi:glutamyl-Q tRNA(Asp) synthetase